MTGDVYREFMLGQPLRQKHIDRLIAEGVPPLWLARTYSGFMSPVSVDRVVIMGDHFEFARHMPQHEGEGVGAFTLLLFDGDGEPADIMAWRPPDFATWLGRCCMLGEENVLAPRLAEPLQVHETVLGWLQAGRQGIYIVDHAQASHLLANETLGVRDPGFAQGLRMRLTRPSPPVVVLQTMECVA